MKKCIYTILAILLLFCPAGCSKTPSIPSLPSIPSIGGAEHLPDKFKKGDVIVIVNDFEIKMKNMEFSTKIIPADPGTFFSTFEVDDPDNTYFHAVFEVKNLRNVKETAADIMAVSLLYDNKTAYMCSAAVERNGDFSLSSDAEVIPLSTETIHYIAEVPKNLTSSNKSIGTQIIIDEHTMTCNADGTVGGGIITVDLGGEAEENTQWQTYEALAMEQPVESEGFGKLTLTKTGFTDSVEPANKGSLYAVNGKQEQDRTYLDTVFAFENLAADNREADQVLRAAVIYDNKYMYDSFILIEQGRNGDLFDAVMVPIKPRATEKLHCAFELPLELENSSKPLALTVSFNSKDYYYRIR